LLMQFEIHFKKCFLCNGSSIDLYKLYSLNFWTQKQHNFSRRSALYVSF